MDGCEIHSEIYRKFAVELQFVDQMIVMHLSLDSVYLARNRVLRRTFFNMNIISNRDIVFLTIVSA